MVHYTSELADSNNQEVCTLLCDLLENQPPYKKTRFENAWYYKLISLKELSIRSFCEACNAESVFCATFSGTFKEIATECMTATTNVFDAASSKKYECFAGKSFILTFTFLCAKCKRPHYYSILITDGNILKIGQYPSYTSNEVQDVRKYKNLISKYYPELTKSINAYSQGMGVGAFVYLRRILEHLVESRFTGDKSWKFDEKFKAVEAAEQLIPEELSPAKLRIYSILSKGVHEYTEEECMELYLVVKFVVERMLDIELEKQENKRKAAAAIAAINNKLRH